MATRQETRFELGEIVDIVGTFRTPKTGAPPNVNIDPSVVTLKIRKPDKTVETRVYGVDAIDHVSTGVYLSKVSLTQEGTYRWRWSGGNGISESGVLSGTFDSVREADF